MVESAPNKKNRRLAVVLAGVVVGMVGLSYASVPLYDLFCRVTGYGGTTQRAEAAPGAPQDAREFTVRFNTDISPELDWSFRPSGSAISVKAGEEHLVFFQATNTSHQPLTGTSVFNVTPQKAGIYFNKVQCFCFEEQLLQSGETMDFPVSFFIDPEISEDRNLDDVKSITLSYTFFPARDVTSGNVQAKLLN